MDHDKHSAETCTQTAGAAADEDDDKAEVVKLELAHLMDIFVAVWMLRRPCKDRIEKIIVLLEENKLLQDCGSSMSDLRVSPQKQATQPASKLSTNTALMLR